MTLSIIIVNYNAGDWLLRSVQSALAFSRAKVYVVDNDSNDDSMQALSSHFNNEKRLSLIQNANNIGFAAANNQVLKQIDTDYALLMNPDCELNEQTIPELLSAFKQYPEMGLASCVILNEDGSVQSTCRRRFPTPWSAFVRLTQLHRLFPARFDNFDMGSQPLPESVDFIEAVSGAFMLVNMQAVQQVGLLDEGYFMHCEDLDWCKRFELADWKVGFVPTASVLHAKGVSSRSRPIGVLWTLHKGMLRFFDKFYKAQYSWALRWLVKLGVYMSFVARAFKSLFIR